MTLESAVVGGGVVSDKHLSGLQNCPETDLVAVCDLDESRAERKAMEYDVDAYADVEALLAREELDWLHLCTPAQSHLRLAEMALQDGLAIQIEPPVTASLAEARALERLARNSEGRVSVAHGHSFSPVVREATALIDAGRIGALRSIQLLYGGGNHPDDPGRGTRTPDFPGGEFEAALPTPIHVLLHLGGLPSTADAIRAGTATQRRDGESVDYDGVQFSYTTADDVLCSATVVASEVPQRTVQLHGEQGTLVVDLVSQSLTVRNGAQRPAAETDARGLLSKLVGRLQDAVRNARPTGGGTDDGWAPERDRNPTHYQIERDARAIESGDSLTVPVGEGTWTLQIMDAIRESTDGPTDGDRIHLETETP